MDECQIHFNRHDFERLFMKQITLLMVKGILWYQSISESPSLFSEPWREASAVSLKFFSFELSKSFEELLETGYCSLSLAFETLCELLEFLPEMLFISL